jgi:hypothetical protein
MFRIRSFHAKSKPKLLEQVRNALRVRHYSLRTEETYVRWLKSGHILHRDE